VLDCAGLSYIFKETLEGLIGKLLSETEDLALPNLLVSAVALARSLPFEVNLWRVQNVYYELLHSKYPEFKKRAERGDKLADEWASAFIRLGEQLSMKVE
jgi:hypothetical protein